VKVEAVQARTVNVLALIGISLFGLSQCVSLVTAEETTQSILTPASAAAGLCLFPVNHSLCYR